MFHVAYHSAPNELLVDGSRVDYKRLASAVHQALSTDTEIVLPVESVGSTKVTHFTVRRCSPPNRVSHSGGVVVFAIATALQEQFLSFIEFPADDDLSDSPVQYHHHYEAVGDDGAYIASDSLPVVFGLEKPSPQSK